MPLKRESEDYKISQVMNRRVVEDRRMLKMAKDKRFYRMISQRVKDK